MKTHNAVTIRQSLLRNLLVMTAMLAVGLLLATGWGVQRSTHLLSEALISRTTLQVESELKGFFAPVNRQLLTVAGWGRNGMLGLEDPAGLNRLFVPLMLRHEQVSSVVLANESGAEYMLRRDGEGWSVREILPGQADGRARLTHWDQAAMVGEPGWIELEDYAPHQRPWYLGALKYLAGDAQLSDSVFWTRPYLFFTAQAPGMTASIGFRDAGGQTWVAAFDILLSDISRFTMSQRISREGQVVVLSDDDFRVIGLPWHHNFDDPRRMRESLLRTPGELGMPVLARAMGGYAGASAQGRQASLLTADDRNWWVGIEEFALAPERQLFTTVVIPEDDLYGSLRQMQWIVLIALAVVLLLAMLRVFSLARRFSTPVEALVEDSHRISAGDLEDGTPIESPVEEFQRLARAHDHMREGLRNKLRMEKHMRLARKIQQDTFPVTLPRLDGYQLAGWSEPAEDAGGDTYDLLGMQYDANRGKNVLAQGRPDSVLMLLADAAGHGVGPALSVTQVRAMIRLAARMGGEAADTVAHVNDQLCEDLSDGRFITAWFGWLHGGSNKLFNFSAGQGPMIHFSAARDEFTLLKPDMPPLGILDGMPVTLEQPLELEPGDLFVVISDGLVEPANPTGEMFGEERVKALLRENRHDDAEQILEKLRRAVEEFTQGAPAEDDRTVIVIKRNPE